ncbi:hypothetical protein ZIOFF_071572 [Zingiber officinale]|uniref:nicotianamine aminotransferase n=1 Tax=Zingiber officinale TaxID=94328 RepID=A0A8J5C8G3_ZINOF|nr:hypothetical protein ZIOFF_071572 [Zingiber officinale]
MGDDGGHAAAGRWGFGANALLAGISASSIRAVLNVVMSEVREDGPRPVLPLAHGDPACFSCFRTTSVAEEAIVDAVRSGNFNSYASTQGIVPARCAIAKYLSRDLPHKLSPDDIFVTAGCSQAIEIVISALASPGANILLPRPGYPFYLARSAFSGLEARHFDLLPDKGWEIDLEAVEALADENTVAIVLVNPSNPCGNVFSHQHLAKVAETAKKLGILVIADEVYGHLTFGNVPFTPMAAFGKIVPVLTLGSISKRWVVPGWRLGWIAKCGPDGVFEHNKFVDNVRVLLNITTDPATFIQSAVPTILENTENEFFQKTVDILKKAADICYDKLKEIDCITCPHKPEGSMFVMVKLNVSHLEDIHDDTEFCSMLAKEESVIVLPGKKHYAGVSLGLKNWLRVTFAIEPSSLEEALGRLKSFCNRHAKQSK